MIVIFDVEIPEITLLYQLRIKPLVSRPSNQFLRIYARRE